MGIIVDHEARKRDILEKALQLFAEQGYDDVTFQKIADRCGIVRTTLYKYFRHKREIFDYTIQLSTNELAQAYPKLTDAALPACQKIKNVLNHVLLTIFRHRTLLTVILDYVLSAQRAGRSMRKPIERHTVALKALVRRLLKDGVASGEFAPIHIGTAYNLLYAILESAILRITISENAKFAELKAMVDETVEGLRA